MIAATEPKKNLSILTEEKLSTAKILQDELPNMLETIKASISPDIDHTESEIKYYKGKNGVKKIYEEALRAKELRSYANISIMHNILPEKSQTFGDALKNNKMFEIIEDSISSREQIEFQIKNANNERYFYKFLPKEVKLSAADTLIYDNKVAIINVDKQITGVVLHNISYFNNTKAIFDSYWNMLS